MLCVALGCLATLCMARPLAAQEPVAQEPVAQEPVAQVPAADGASAPGVVLRQSIDPTAGIVAGQHVALYVDVLFPGEMPHPPRVDLPDVAGLQIFRFETQATTISDTINNQSYVGQRFEFALYPRRGGTFIISPAAVTLLNRQGDPTGDMQGDELRFDVAVPAGMDVSQPIVATRHLTLDQQWMPAPGGRFKAGDAIVRTITRSAEDVPGLAMRELDMSVAAGVRAYADPPDIDDHVDRGIVTGRRVDRVTYVFERGGHFTLPGVSQAWWDLAAGAMKRADAPGVTLDIAAAQSDAAVDRDHASMPAKPSLLIFALVLLIVSGLGLYYLKRPAKRKTAEDEAFAAFRRIRATADPVAAYQAFSRWCCFLSPADRRSALAAAAGLGAALFAADRKAWTVQNSVLLFDRCAAIRRSPPSTGSNHPLPPLNPVRLHVAHEGRV
jgi:hypothetical protein